MCTLENFDKITERICQNYEGNKSVLYECYEDGRLLLLKEFYNNIRKQEDKIADEANGKEANAASISLTLDIKFFAKAFKTLDEYPSNVHKVKKSLPPVKERSNSSLRRQSASLPDVTFTGSNENVTSQSLISLCEIDPTPSIVDTFADFRKFEKQLQQLNAISEHEADKLEYMKKLKQLKNFSMQSNRIFPKEDTVEAALNDKQEQTLLQISKAIEDVNHTRSISNISQTLQHNKSVNLDDISNVLSFCTEAVNTLNTIKLG